MQKGKNVLIVVLTVVVGWFVMTGAAPEKPPFVVMQMIGWMYGVCVIPLVLYYFRSESNIPYIPVLGVIYFFYFGYPPLVSYRDFLTSGYNDEIIARSMSYALSGIVALFVAFYTAAGSVVMPFVKPVQLSWNSKKALRMAYVTLLIGLSVVLYLTTQRVFLVLGGFVDAFQQLFRLGLITLLVLEMKHELGKVSSMLLWFFFIPLRVLIDLSTGSTLVLLIDMLVLLFLIMYYRKSFPVVQGIICGVCFFAIFSVRNEFREVMYQGDVKSPLARATLYFELIKGKFEKQGVEKKQHIDEGYYRLQKRTDDLNLLIRVVDMTPSRVPYWEGYTYSTFLTSFIPRFILPNKPVRRLGQDFGHRYGILLVDDGNTSVNLPINIEMYANFGYWGIVIGMFLMGLFLKWFYVTFNHAGAGDGGIIITALILSNVLMFEADFCLMFGPIIQYIIFFYIILSKVKPDRPRPG